MKYWYFLYKGIGNESLYERKTCKRTVMKIIWKFLEEQGYQTEKKALVNCRDNEGVAMCKANDSNLGTDKSTLILGQEKSRKHC